MKALNVFLGIIVQSIGTRWVKAEIEIGTLFAWTSRKEVRKNE